MFKITSHLEYGPASAHARVAFDADLGNRDKETPTGFHITFANGWTASVQWSDTNYCERYRIHPNAKASPDSKDAECYAWHKDGEKIGEVLAYQKPEEVAVFLQAVASFAPGKKVKDK